MNKKFVFSEQLKDEMLKISEQFETKRAATIPLLHLAQDRFGYISPEIEEQVAHILNLPVIKIREVVSFYSMFHKKPVGKHVIHVCQNLSCSLRGADAIIGHLKHKLNIETGGTSSNRKYTLKTVECLGACELAPVMRLNSKYIGNLTTEKVDDLIKGLP